jgi:hypothetical protein
MPSVLGRLEALNEKATPGPWFARSLSPDDPNGYSLECDIDETSWEVGEGNWPLVAAARNALPNLLVVAKVADEYLLARSPIEAEDARRDLHAALAPLLREAE